MKQTTTYGLIYGVILAVLVAGAGLWLNQPVDYHALKSQLRASHVLYNPDKPLPAFSLLDQHGKKFDNQSLKNQWTLLFFAYTHCPDVCPTALMDMVKLKKILTQQNANIVPKVVLITFDPLRDTPKVLNTYLAHFDSDFVGVSGEQAQIDKLLKPFGAYYERVIYGADNRPIILTKNQPITAQMLKDGYLINHTAWIYLLNPEGLLVAGFPTPHKADLMAKDVRLLTELN